MGKLRHNGTKTHVAKDDTFVGGHEIKQPKQTNNMKIKIIEKKKKTDNERKIRSFITWSLQVRSELKFQEALNFQLAL